MTIPSQNYQYIKSGSQYFQPNRVSKAYFPDPWLDYASTVMPRSLDDVLWWAEYLWLNNGAYRQASIRVSRHFLTKLEAEGDDDEENEEHVKFMEDKLDIWTKLGQIGDDLQCYGTVFRSVYLPFRRNLVCPQCGFSRPIEKVDYTFENFTFKDSHPCQNKMCNYKGGPLRRNDLPSQEEDKIHIIKWDPREMEIIDSPASGKRTFVWKINPELKRRIERGDREVLENTPWEIVECVRDKLEFIFDENQIFYWCEEIVSGIKTGGWGLPRVLSNFKQIFYQQILRRANEAIAFDYILPLRIITPKQASNVNDPLIKVNMSGFTAQIQDIIARHRLDPATWHNLPIPVEAQVIGGEGKQLVPIELLEWSNDTLLNDLGYPAELYKGTIQVQAAPTALRLFQMQWSHIPMGYKKFLNWLWGKLSPAMNWPEISWSLTPPTLADDLEQRGLLLQLMGANQVSPQTALGSLGLNPLEEVRRIYNYQRAQSTEARKFEEDQKKSQEFEDLKSMVSPTPVQQQMATAQAAQAAQGGGGGGMVPQGGGMPQTMGAGGVGGGGQATTPADMMSQAESIANQLLAQPYETRRGQMNDLAKANKPLHAMVKDMMSQIRQKAKSEGGYQALQGMVGGGG